MRPFFFLSTVFAMTLLLAGCHSPNRKVETKAVLVPSGTSATNMVTSKTARYLIPINLPTFGVSTSNSIRVAVFGADGTVNQPGYYYLPKGAVVYEAVEAARGLGIYAWWRYQTGIERPNPDGSFTFIRFTRNRKAEEQIFLQDGDRIRFGREVF